jgi:hypothetical protein
MCAPAAASGATTPPTSTNAAPQPSSPNTSVPHLNTTNVGEPLSATQRALSVTQRALRLTQRALSATQRALSVTQRALRLTQRALSATQRALSVTQRALRLTQRALSATQRALSVRRGTHPHGTSHRRVYRSPSSQPHPSASAPPRHPIAASSCRSASTTASRPNPSEAAHRPHPLLRHPLTPGRGGEILSQVRLLTTSAPQSAPTFAGTHRRTTERVTRSSSSSAWCRRPSAAPLAPAPAAGCGRAWSSHTGWVGLSSPPPAHRGLLAAFAAESNP